LLIDDRNNRKDKIVPLPDGKYQMVDACQKDDGLGVVEVRNNAVGDMEWTQRELEETRLKGVYSE